MKLYTEEQVRHAIKMARSSNNYFTTPFLYDQDEILEILTPIELLSDEEIGQEFKFLSENWEIRQAAAHGAQWMRDKLTNTKEK